ncbi:membrane hypothetical protein [Candidatus Zixiibacteriota bacterium]|nr:membrane hypothetical protein [candidate division Zixibacteria bacterium]
MKIAQYDFPLNEKIKGNPIFLLIFLLIRIYRYLFALPVISLIAAFLLFLVAVNPSGLLSLAVPQGRWRLYLLLINILTIPIAAVLEEFSHAAVAVQLGRIDLPRVLRIRTLASANDKNLLAFSFSIANEGHFSAPELLKIRLGGPIGAMGLSVLLLIILYFIGVVEAGFGLIAGLVMPVSSLVPYRMLIESDGYAVRKVSRELKLPIVQLWLIALECFYLVIRFLLGAKVPFRYAISRQIVEAADFYSRKEYGKAAELLSEVIQFRREDPEMSNNLALALVGSGIRLDEAEALAHCALEKDPNDPQYNDTMGQVCFKLGNRSGGLEYLKKAHRLAPSDPEIRRHLDEAEAETKT